MIAKAEEIIMMFINAGIHLDSVNTDGFTAAKSSSLRKLNILGVLLMTPYIWGSKISNFFMFFFLIFFRTIRIVHKAARNQFYNTEMSRFESDCTT